MNVFFIEERSSVSLAVDGECSMKRASLSLHHLTAMAVSARQLVSLAAQARCDNVCLFTYMPAAFRHKYPVIDAQDMKPLIAEMKRQSIGCLSLEVFPLTQDADFGAMESGLATGAKLGAHHATVHCHLADMGEARDALGKLAEIANEYAIKLGIEFNPFSKVTTLKQAAELIKPLGGGTIGLVLDTLHAARSYTQPDDIAAAQHCINFVQISDGPAYIDPADRWKEAMHCRMVPGSGDLPLAAMLGAFSSDISVSIEVPQTPKNAGSADAKMRVIGAVKGTRKILEGAGFITQT
jgi:sugar phosphate isomerase/epimerase